MVLMVAGYHCGIAVFAVLGHLAGQSALALWQRVRIPHIVPDGVNRTTYVGVHAKVAAKRLDKGLAPVLALHSRIQHTCVGHILHLHIRRQMAAIIKLKLSKELLGFIVRFYQ